MPGGQYEIREVQYIEIKKRNYLSDAEGTRDVKSSIKQVLDAVVISKILGRVPTRGERVQNITSNVIQYRIYNSV